MVLPKFKLHDQHTLGSAAGTSSAAFSKALLEPQPHSLTCLFVFLADSVLRWGSSNVHEMCTRKDRCVEAWTSATSPYMQLHQQRCS
eukprot:4522070-Amphidinium_carterae.2